MADSTESSENSRSKEVVSKNSRDPYFLSNSDQPTSQLVANLFDGTNFTVWSRGVRMALGAKNKLGFIDGALKMPNREENEEEYDDWCRNDNMIRCSLINSMNSKQSANFMGSTTAHQLWEELKSRHGQSNLPLLYHMKRKVVTTAQRGMPIVEYYSILKNLWEEITGLEGIPQCECGAMKSCRCKLLQQALEEEDRNQLIQFLIGLDDQCLTMYVGDPSIEEEFASTDIANWLKRALGSRSPIPFRFPKGKLGGPPGVPAECPPWLREEDINYFAEKILQRGISGPLNYYRNVDRNWELTAPWTGAQIEVPVKFMVGELDLTLSFPGVRDYIDKGGLKKDVPLLDEIVIIEGAAHFVQQEKPEEVSKLILEYLNGF